MQDCLKQNYFRFNNKFYSQKKGLPMGSSMSPVMAEIYMNYFENKIMSTVKNEDKIKKWMRYVAVSYTHLDVYKRQASSKLKINPM